MVLPDPGGPPSICCDFGRGDLDGPLGLLLAADLFKIDVVNGAVSKNFGDGLARKG